MKLFFNFYFNLRKSNLFALKLKLKIILWNIQKKQKHV